MSGYGRLRTFKIPQFSPSECPLSGKADIREAEKGPTKLPQANASLKCRNSTNHAPATSKMRPAPLLGSAFLLHSSELFPPVLF